MSNEQAVRGLTAEQVELAIKALTFYKTAFGPGTAFQDYIDSTIAALASSGTSAPAPPSGNVYGGTKYEAPALPPRDEESVTISHPFCQKCGAPHAAIRCRHCIEQIRKEALEEAAQEADKVICEEFRKGWLEGQHPRSEIVAKYTARAIRALADSRRK
jgi:hypothetical protein